MQELHESEMFRSVLNEMLSELKQLQNSTKEMNKTILGLNERIDRFDQRLEDLQVVAPPPDLQPLKEGILEFNQQAKETMEEMREVFRGQMQKIADTLAAEPRPIVRRISLFPDNDYRGSYKYFIRGLFLATVGVCLVGALYALGSQWLEQRREERRLTRVPVQERSMSFPERNYQPGAPSPAPGRAKKAGKRHREVDSVAAVSQDTGR